MGKLQRERGVEEGGGKGEKEGEEGRAERERGLVSERGRRKEGRWGG